MGIGNLSYPDQPIEPNQDIGDFGNYNSRDILVKGGASTIDLKGGLYTIQDFVTTYHPDGENPPAYRYPRDLNVDWNVRYGYLLLEDQYVVDKAIKADDEDVTVSGTIKPKQWTQEINSYADDLSGRALITDPDFMKESIIVVGAESNPNRFDTTFNYKRSGRVIISSTDATAGFAFGI